MTLTVRVNSHITPRSFFRDIGQRFLFTVLMYLMLLAVAASGALGQALMVDQAYSLLKEGQLEKSRLAIDIASTHPSTINDARTWYLRSFIYKEIASEDSLRTQDFRSISIQSAFRCMEIDSLNRFSEDCRGIISYVYTIYLNEAIAYLNHQDYTTVLASLQHILDTKEPFSFTHQADVLFYYGYALLQLENEASARPYLFQAWQYGYQDPLIYEIETLHRMNISQWDSARWYLTRGRQQFPEDINLQIAELNFLMQREDYKAAEETVEQYLAQHPEHIEGLLLAGTIYEKLLTFVEEEDRYFDKQISAYERILLLAPDHLQANYNLGIAYYNRAVRLINGAAQNYDLDIMAFNQLLEQCSALFLKALPYIEKVNTLDNTHINALKALEGIYYNINDYEQYSLVKEKLQKL